MPIDDPIALYDPADSTGGSIPNKVGSGGAAINGTPAIQANEDFSFVALGTDDAVRLDIPALDEVTVCYFARIKPPLVSYGYHHIFTFNSDQLQGLFKRSNQAIGNLNVRAGELYYYDESFSSSKPTGIILQTGEWILIAISGKADRIRAWRNDWTGGDRVPITFPAGTWSIGMPDGINQTDGERGALDVGPIRVYDRFLKESEVVEIANLYAPSDGGPQQVSKVSGIVQIDGSPVQRKVRAFGYNPTIHNLDGESVNLSKSLGHATSDPDTGEYTIDLLAGYDKRIFVVAFDDYGADFTPEMVVAVGDRIHPTTPNGHVWECTSAGTLPSAEPTWVVDTETAKLYGTASMIAKPFYRPMVHGPVMPEVTAEQ
ncbi:hypothetical protein AS1_19 [Marinobacter phage AS1]|nr:hypothetical protein AS1_19 [Marinobacter phage AS1]